MPLALSDIKQRLIALGITEADVPTVMEDVQKIIFAKIFVELVPRITPELQTTIAGMSYPQLEEYLRAHPELFPGLTTEHVEEVAEQTWEGYFAHFQS
jgi:hypothetical protein